MSLLNTAFAERTQDLLGAHPALRDGTASVCAPLQSKTLLPSRIAVIGNYLPRHCGIATFTTDLCAAISSEFKSARLLALPVNDTEGGYDYPDRVRWSIAQDDVKSYHEAAEFLVRWSHSRIPARLRTRRSNSWILRPFATPCANVLTCLGARWHGSEWRRDIWRVFHASATSAWSVQESSSPRICLRDRWAVA